MCWWTATAWLHLLSDWLLGASAEDGRSGESESILICLPFAEGL